MALLFLSGLVVLLLDQSTKQWVRARIPGRAIDFRVISFGYVAGRRRTLPRSILVLALMTSLLCSFLLIQLNVWVRNPAAMSALGIAFGGATGNLLDLLRYHHVVDFIDLKWWPVFNIADVAIIGGLFTALLLG
ncbi:MAG TPA: signal peptidase II [Gemmatimonadaceae bacterium]|nr:signal peptidase II [Gemmatimonadaceae bacterium]